MDTFDDFESRMNALFADQGFNFEMAGRKLAQNSIKRILLVRFFKSH